MNAPALSLKTLETLKSGQNLLAFSHGVDSTALFYLLDEAGVKFDLAIVDYNVRAQSKDEITSARQLALKFNKQIYVKSVCLGASNFEHEARAARYEFFSEICREHGYENLILAHQFDDKFEWFLMQLGRGAGLSELLGMQELEAREDYVIARPLLGVRKCELERFLRERNLKYFTDETNLTERFKRGFIRAKFSEPFLDEYFSGVKKSFEFLAADALNLTPEISNPAAKIYLVKRGPSELRGVDQACKRLGLVLSSAQRNECVRCLENGADCVLGGKVAVGAGEKFIFVTPYAKPAMEKKFKEACRQLAVPPINRGFLFASGTDIALFEELL
ncbi:tRNA(Ile)-lysidine synthetase [Campylobacter rectus RM3267]|uniref:tRNA(Ile)-lysidine synthase n=2 Tax=Campylobacter rectus TaxID=203 RepID=A0A6G5QNX6_CAMRE|nr:tRNA lysidine(34) synthetase TilS [Campylobacter rectus]EEF15006.1 tRNA(Ile)-lysidine synthetase [Campylobacter rectus RM3267]QCD47370.1 tRNA(Ile)-lysidine synthetase [Campylobacter rectus]UEB48066.1 tRNA lysidine(34) synthetase TilS [Campylobacter rectus]